MNPWLPLIGFSIWQGLVSLEQVNDRNRKYAAARAYADSVGKPMLMVGGPYGSSPLRRIFSMKAHGCGDVCLDIDPEACQGCPTIVADIRDIPFPDQHFGSAFVSHVLEHLPAVEDAGLAVNELMRVADQVWVSYPSKQSVIAYLIPGHYLWVTEKDGALLFEQRLLINGLAVMSIAN